MTAADISDVARRAIDQFPSMTVDALAGHIKAAQDDIADLVKGLANRDAANLAYRMVLRSTVQNLRAREERLKLERRVAALENSPKLAYRGPWRPRTNYAPGSFVTNQGSIWHANEFTESRPGSDDSWTLACKHGRDGKSK